MPNPAPENISEASIVLLLSGIGLEIEREAEVGVM